MNLTKDEKTILIKRRFRRIVKFWFGVIFRSITYYLIFGRHLDENGKKTGGRWVPSNDELKLVARKKEFKKAKKQKRTEEKVALKAKKFTEKSNIEVA